jgi:hypothetical protein
MTEQVKSFIRPLLEAWPIVLAVFTLTVFGAQASAMISEHDTRLAKHDVMLADRADRLARIEEKQMYQIEKLDSIEKKIDRLTQ